MTIQQELISAVFGLMITIIGAVSIFSYWSKEMKAKEWNRRYGNTDFENPYRR